MTARYLMIVEHKSYVKFNSLSRDRWIEGVARFLLVSSDGSPVCFESFTPGLSVCNVSACDRVVLPIQRRKVTAKVKEGCKVKTRKYQFHLHASNISWQWEEHTFFSSQRTFISLNRTTIKDPNPAQWSENNCNKLI